jgi:2-polyprenyl-3-methyl-5-hydroxy-6-metoxy-1,4-benzoquinol methylase
MKEPILESLLREFRIKQVLPYVSKYKNANMLDIGCGWEAKLLKNLEPYILRGTGIDFKTASIKSKKIQTITSVIDKKLPFKNNTFDFITLLAVLEHLEHPSEILSECARILKPGGGILITVPSWHAKPVLEFLAYKLKIVSADEINDHKRYYNREDLFYLFKRIKDLKIVEHKYFQWKFNNKLYAISIKKKS